ncbi:UDP-N-acetylglucosamine 4,6-dehydratase (inverting) [Methanosarcina sp. 1.H.T.1A.1]|uniref:UDP-N-acetylglucosamine 4,6-dehydratase (inverting) n=1 Tax=Methanosarcina sp. 1.H.T.1A.1 TaxID=1483602 RepID=UPI00064EF0F7|nr:UDP-N-acetylglucosamine 4,6-dehydratase (inverting) [Methanosarcina sp. 1.H.T.1A.1]
MDDKKISSIFDEKTILLTGGTGSFGNKFTEIVLKEYNPESLRIYSRGEYNQYLMDRKFNDKRLRFLIGDVRDKNRLQRAMNGVDLVVHAAALKQVPACEYNPIEAVRTNIEGTMNIIDTAIDNGVEKVMAISTDKAVHPVNLYGATKMVAEKLFVQGNAYSGKNKTKFSCTRYGNVIGSRGSVIPLFEKQKETGVLTITDERMTRFWLTLDQGVHFVLNSISLMHGGEIFVPKIPSMRITDLANAMAPEAKKEFTGIRPGEKLHEIMITEDESRHAKEFPDYFIIEPEFPFWKKEKSNLGKILPAGFRYSSDINEKWLSKEELKKMIH